MPRPLAARMRPRSLDEVVGQEHLTAPDAPFRRALERGAFPAALLWGPPGTGKTTLARLCARAAGLRFAPLSAVQSGLKDLRKLVPPEPGDGLFASPREGVLLFVDEIHRWSKTQQDALLHHVEEGTVGFLGATTENPAFHVIPALRSRLWLLQLHPLAVESIETILRRALADEERGLGGRVRVTDEALGIIAGLAGGDARRALGILERAAAASDGVVDPVLLRRLAETGDLHHAPGGDAHYDTLSALIKSIRGSDPDAAVYWLARLLEAGEDPMIVARRLVIAASEDIGNADPRALGVAVDALRATREIGMPEARIVLAQATTWLAAAPKSNAAYRAVDAALAEVRRTGALPVPLHLRNAPTGLARALGHGRDYRYPHDHPDAIVEQRYLPDELEGARYYRPTDRGAERTIRERLRWWADRLRERDR